MAGLNWIYKHIWCRRSHSKSSRERVGLRENVLKFGMLLLFVYLFFLHVASALMTQLLSTAPTWWTSGTSGTDGKQAGMFANSTFVYCPTVSLAQRSSSRELDGVCSWGFYMANWFLTTPSYQAMRCNNRALRKNMLPKISDSMFSQIKTYMSGVQGQSFSFFSLTY